MRLLLDTHAYFWWVLDQPELSRHASEVLAQDSNDIVLSAVVIWELATKSRLGKLPQAQSVLDDVADSVLDAALIRLPVSLDHARLAGSLSSPHKDPFDRMLAAQAILEDLTLVTTDPAFRTLSCRTLW